MKKSKEQKIMTPVHLPYGLQSLLVQLFYEQGKSKNWFSITTVE